MDKSIQSFKVTFGWEAKKKNKTNKWKEKKKKTKDLKFHTYSIVKVVADLIF